MNPKILSELLNKKKKDAVIRIEIENKPSNEEDGLAPDPKEEEIEGKEGKEELSAEEVLGRKPMSLAAKDDDDGDDDSSVMGDTDDDREVLSHMEDPNLIEALKAGKKPTRLWDKVQMQILNRKKK